MKNYDEMANDVFRRIDEYKVEQKRKRKIVARTASSLCCLCLVAFMGFSVWQNGQFNTELPVASDDPTITGEKDHTPHNTDSPELPTNQNYTIVFNHIDSVEKNTANIALLWNDFVQMSIDEANQYYGVDVIPTLPNGIKEEANQTYGIFKRNGGVGEVYWDQINFKYASEDNSKVVNVDVAKGNLPFYDYVPTGVSEEKSLINNVDIFLGQMDDGSLYAKFLYHNVGFNVTAIGVSQDEFVEIIASILK